MTDAFIDIRHLSKTYHLNGLDSPVLKNVSLRIASGEFVAILGASGSGKSTLMNVMGLLDKADTGEYWLKNDNMALLSDDELALLRNRYIGFVFQQFNLLPRFNVKQNVALPLMYRNMCVNERDERVMAVLSHVGMETFIHHRPTQLSGGQQQRVAIARALVGEPEVIFADEPTGALDSQTGEKVLSLFHALHREGRTIVLITHDETIAKQCQRRLRMMDGCLMESEH